VCVKYVHIQIKYINYLHCRQDEFLSLDHSDVYLSYAALFDLM